MATGTAYFVLVFGTGFLFGVIRVLWVVPRLGERWAELIEAPFMLAAVFFAARWVTRRLQAPRSVPRRLGVGLIALSLLVLAELTLVLRVRGLSLGEYVADRDPVSGTVYLLSLVIFALMPLASRPKRC